MAEQAFREMIANVCNMYMRTNPEYSNTWELLRKRLSHSFDDFHSEWEFQNDLMNPRVKQFLAVYQGVCPTVKWSEPLNVPMVAYACTTCAIDVRFRSFQIRLTCHFSNFAVSALIHATQGIKLNALTFQLDLCAPVPDPRHVTRSSEKRLTAMKSGITMRTTLSPT
jgi:hypothetical protein